MSTHTGLPDKLGVRDVVVLLCDVFMDVVFNGSVELCLVSYQAWTVRSLIDRNLESFFFHCEFVGINFAFVLFLQRL